MKNKFKKYKLRKEGMKIQTKTKTIHMTVNYNPWNYILKFKKKTFNVYLYVYFFYRDLKASMYARSSYTECDIILFIGFQTIRIQL